MEELPETGANPFGAVNGRLDVEQAVKRLPEELKEVILLRYFQELKLREVAEITGAGLPLVKCRLRKAKELLKQYMGEEGRQ